MNNDRNKPLAAFDPSEGLARDLETALSIIRKMVEVNPAILTDSRFTDVTAQGRQFSIISNLLSSERLDSYLETKERDAAQTFEMAVCAKDFSHISTRGSSAHAYRHDASSPSGVLRSASISRNNRYYQGILEAHRKTEHQGPQRGEIALRKQGY